MFSLLPQFMKNQLYMAHLRWIGFYRILQFKSSHITVGDPEWAMMFYTYHHLTGVLSLIAPMRKRLDSQRVDLLDPNELLLALVSQIMPKTYAKIGSKYRKIDGWKHRPIAYALVWKLMYGPRPLTSALAILYYFNCISQSVMNEGLAQTLRLDTKTDHPQTLLDMDEFINQYQPKAGEKIPLSIPVILMNCVMDEDPYYLFLRKFLDDLESRRKTFHSHLGYIKFALQLQDILEPNYQPTVVTTPRECDTTQEDA